MIMVTNYKKGLWAETVARVWLRLKFYRILEERYKTPVGEIDIVAVKGENLAFIEVKARGDLVTASLSVTPSQQSRIYRASKAFLSRHPRYLNHTIRFDVLLVRPCRFPVHILDAWQGGFRLN